MLRSLLTLNSGPISSTRGKTRKTRRQPTKLRQTQATTAFAPMTLESLEPRVLFHGGEIDGIVDIEVVNGTVVVVEAPNSDEHLPHQDSQGKQNEHLALLDLVKYADVNRAAINDGLWSDPATWAGGLIPNANANVLIPHDVTVIYDLNNLTPYRTVRVDGQLHFKHNKNTKMLVDTLVVSPEGTLTIGTENQPIQANVTATIVIVDNGEINTDWDPKLLSRGVLSHGVVDIHGQAKTGFHALAKTPHAGNTKLLLAGEETTWRIGDQLVLTGTDPEQNQDEELEILDIQYDASQDITTISVRPLAFNHQPPADDLSVYVANLTRNVVITSQNKHDISRRGHVMFMHSPHVEIHHATLDELGRTDKKSAITDKLVDNNGNLIFGDNTNPRGRYALHLHRTGTAPGAAPAVVEGVVVDGSPGWGVVNHSSNANVSDSVSFNVVGAGFVGEAGDEIGSFIGNIAIRSEGSGEVIDQRQIFPDKPFDLSNPKNDDFGHGGHGFWLQGPGIAVENNIAVGHRHAGFAFWSRALNEPDVMDEVSFGFGNVATFRSENVIDQPELIEGVDFVRSDLVRLRSFKNNVAFASASGLDISRHMLTLSSLYDYKSVVEDFTAWNIGTFTDERNVAINGDDFGAQGGNNGVTIRYSHNLVFRNLRLIGTNDPTSVGINRNHAVSDVVFENPQIEGFGIGINTPRRGDIVVEGGFLDNEMDIQVTNANGGSSNRPLDVDIRGVEFRSNSNPLINLKTDIASSISLTQVFAPSSVTLNNDPIFFNSQNANFVPFPTSKSLSGLKTQGLGIHPSLLVGKTNQQLWNNYGLAVGGQITPNEAVVDARAVGGLIIKNDAGITVTSASNLKTTEAGGEATFDVVLNSKPTANVSIGIASSDTSEGIVSNSKLTFTTSNWNVPRTVTVTGVDDDDVDGDTAYKILIAASVSNDLNYHGINPSDLNATNADNDTDDAPTDDAPTDDTVRIINNGDSGFQMKGKWTGPYLGQGFEDTVHFSARGDGSDTATWTFGGLSDGIYRVSATWSKHDNRATNTPFTVLDGSVERGTIRVNQELAPSADVVVDGVNFQDLGTFAIVNGSLVVQLTDDADQYVIADAIRVERIGDVAKTIDNSDSGFAHTGDWVGPYLGQGFEDAVHFSAHGDGSDVATWTFKGLLPGQYRVSTTWSAHSNRATDAPFMILDDTAQRGKILVNQELAPTADVIVDGTSFQKLGTFDITSGELVVRLTDDADQYVLADAVHIEWVGNLAKTIDNGDLGFAHTGDWVGPYLGQGFEDAVHFSARGNGSDVASWTFTGLLRGQYSVFVTWSEHPNRATDAPFSVFDNTTQRSNILVNQELAPTADIMVDGTSFQSLGSVDIASGVLVVRLTDDADQYVIADAVRIERIGELGLPA